MGAPPPPAPPSPLVREGGGGAAPAPEADAALHAALLEAHAEGDERALVGLYARAADAAEAAGAVDAACFFLTQAYVFALSSGAAEAGALHARLLARGREE